MSAAGQSVKRLHSAYAHPVSRKWQSLGSTLSPDNLMYPLFIIDDPNEQQEISAMPGVSRMGINRALEHLDELVPLGLSSVLIFSVSAIEKDDNGSGAVSDANPVYNAILKIKEKFGDQLLVAVDICICPYTSHGHCGVFNDKMEIDNERSIELLANMAGKI